MNNKEETAEAIGKLIERGDYIRDAVHVAVIPMKAAHLLHPGQHIGLVDQETAGSVEKPIGVVDPFLKTHVKAGERFWLCLYPGSITSLNHVWTHPAFHAVESKPEDDPGPVPDKAASEKWLREYASRVSPHDEGDAAYYNLLGAISEGRVFYHGSDLHSREELKDEEELKFHAQIVLGKTISFDTFTFSCSC